MIMIFFGNDHHGYDMTFLENDSLIDPAPNSNSKQDKMTFSGDKEVEEGGYLVQRQHL